MRLILITTISLIFLFYSSCSDRRSDWEITKTTYEICLRELVDPNYSYNIEKILNNEMKFNETVLIKHTMVDTLYNLTETQAVDIAKDYSKTTFHTSPYVRTASIRKIK